MTVTEISKTEFDAICYARNAHLMPLLDEVAYFKEEESGLYGVIVRDFFDGDYGSIVLGRDSNMRFRAIEVPDKFYETPEKAFPELKKKFSKAHSEKSYTFPQGDEKGKPNDLYKIVAKEKRLHPSFIKLINDPLYSSAKAFIGEAVYAYVDVDGNYIKDFQSTGFNSRMWELYLYILLKHQGFEFDNSFKAPDYLLNKGGLTIGLEATTVNADAKLDEPFPKNEREIYDLCRDYLPIKFGSPLFTKLKHEYWRLDHMIGKPLIIAIHDYHMNELLGCSQKALRNYLYGVQYKSFLDNGAIRLELNTDGLPVPEAITSHVYKHKVIPSNFFNQPGAEYISGVLFCNNATLDTFNRFGKLAKMGNHQQVMCRIAEVNDLRSPLYTPKIVEENVDAQNYGESWEDTMCLFHNPKAKYPLAQDLFYGITQCAFNPNSNTFYGPRRTPEYMRSSNRYQ